jgi:hypothetical protein
LSVDSSFLYDQRCGTVIRYFGSLEVVWIPVGVEILGESSFCDSKVRQVHISKSVRILGNIAFLAVNALKVSYLNAIRNFPELNHLHLLGLR